MDPIIYLADDDEDDRNALRQALLKVAPQVSLVEAHDGLHLLSLLEQPTPSGPLSRPLPDLIVLDMNMPKLNGAQVLRKLRAIPTLRHIPIVMLSTARSLRQIGEAYREGFETYIVKPLDLDEYEPIARFIIRQLFDQSD